jgi:short-subunit dehydrogenase
MQQSKIAKEGELSDAKKVAQDGYDALMRGENMVVSGFKNKVKVALSNILSDKAVAKKTHKEQSPTEEKK